jgi:hypothetical protein
MKYAKISDEFIAKGKRAQRELFSIFFKAKINNLDVRLRLFDSLVRSVVMYCSHIWGVQFIDKLINFQLSFLRQLFRLPSYTPHWCLRLESQCKRIEISFIKNVLYFYLKLLSKPDSSLLSQCLSFLRSTQHKLKVKHNWFRDVHNLLAKYELEDLLIMNVDSNLPSSLSLLKNNICNRLDVTVSKLEQEEIVKMQNSSKSPLYQVSRTHCIRDKIMNENVSWSHIVLYVQMKAGIPRVVFKGDTININAMNSYFNPFVSSDLDVCQLCSLNVPETMYQCFFDCPAYFYIRSELLKSLNLPSSQLDLFSKISYFDSTYIKMLYLYLEKALKIRSERINCYV